MIDKIKTGCLLFVIIVLCILCSIWNIWRTKQDIEYKQTIIEMGKDKHQ